MNNQKDPDMMQNIEVRRKPFIVGVMGGLQAFGFIGLFVGPIVLGLLVALALIPALDDLTPLFRRAPRR